MNGTECGAMGAIIIEGRQSVNPVIAARMIPPFLLIPPPPPLSSDTLKEAFIHMGGKIRNVPKIKKQMVVLEIEKWGGGQDIIKDGARKFPS